MSPKMQDDNHFLATGDDKEIDDVVATPPRAPTSSGAPPSRHKQDGRECADPPCCGAWCDDDSPFIKTMYPWTGPIGKCAWKGCLGCEECQSLLHPQDGSEGRNERNDVGNGDGDGDVDRFESLKRRRLRRRHHHRHHHRHRRRRHSSDQGGIEPDDEPSPVVTEDDEGAPMPQSRGRDDVTVIMETSKGMINVTVKPSWAPLGAARFLALSRSGFYDGCRIFRVVRGFVAQFGLNADPHIQRKYWMSSIQDDPPVPNVSNRLGTLSFAAHGANSRSTQVFFNLMDNAQLDGMGFTPFAVVPPDHMEVPISFNAKYGEQPDQGEIMARGNAYLDAAFPGLDTIDAIHVPGDTPTADEG